MLRYLYTINVQYLLGVTFVDLEKRRLCKPLKYTHLKKLYLSLMMEYAKIVKALTANFVLLERMKILQPITVENFCDCENALILNHNAEISYLQGGTREWVQPGELLFIPSKKSMTITYGPVTYDTRDASNISYDYFLAYRWKYLQAAPLAADQHSLGNFWWLSFDARLSDVINLFSALGVPALVIKDSRKLTTLFNIIVSESSSPVAGSDSVLTHYTSLLVLELLRHMHYNQLLPEQLNIHHSYHEDTKFLQILDYIHKNLDKDLSNTTIAKAHHVSKEYLRHYFRSRVGVLLREYVETHRLEKAMRLLRSTSKSISDIFSKVGFAELPYFCRRFKVRMGMPASKVRGGMR